MERQVRGRMRRATHLNVIISCTSDDEDDFHQKQHLNRYIKLGFDDEYQ